MSLKGSVKFELNPFGSDDNLNVSSSGNPFGSDEDEPLPKRKSAKPPRPPPPNISQNLKLSVSCLESPDKKLPVSSLSTSRGRSVSPSLSATSDESSSAVRLRKKQKPAPLPPVDIPVKQTSKELYQLETKEEDLVMTAKQQKEMLNRKSKLHTNETHVVSALNKREHGEFRHKKGPAPLRPIPQRRAVKKLPLQSIQQELWDIDVKQTELERQGVLLETSIRACTEQEQVQEIGENKKAQSIHAESSPLSMEVEEMILHLFELVNEKNELFRRQTELMYLKREKRLEEEHADLEYQIRCLMLRPASEKTADDVVREEDLIARLVKVVEQRDEIISCLELDRLREAQEDESIAVHMTQYHERHIDGATDVERRKNKKHKKGLKLLKKKKKKKSQKCDADDEKDVDETEVKEKMKKKWFKKM